MLTKRIIPCLDVKGGLVVKGTNFVSLRTAGDPVDLARRYNEEGADELVFLDITASIEKRKTMVELASRVAQEVFIPFTVGGGISAVEQIQGILAAGADKVSLNTAAVKNPALITGASDQFGRQAVVVAIDARKKQGTAGAKAGWDVLVNGGRTQTGLDAVSWAMQAEKLGAGEILLTSMDRDGTKDGYDLELCKAVTGAVNIPVIASGGAGKASDFADAFTAGGADAALAASLFHYNELSISQVKECCAKRGIPMRCVQ
jgi:imidazole glycerol-phosphate synthase subunit HisF